MELTAKTLQEVTFGAKVRGYDPAEVDEFIAAVAEGIEELQERLRRANDRATQAEQQAAALKSAPPPEQPAQQPASAEISKVWERAAAAAESAIGEAKEEAGRILEEARQLSEVQLFDARQQAETSISSAQAEAQRIRDEAQGHLRAEIEQLEHTRNQLKSDVDNLAYYLDGELGRVRGALTASLASLDEYAGVGGGGQPPNVGDVQVPVQPSHPVHPAESAQVEGLPVQAAPLQAWPDQGDAASVQLPYHEPESAAEHSRVDVSQNEWGELPDWGQQVEEREAEQHWPAEPEAAPAQGWNQQQEWPQYETQQEWGVDQSAAEWQQPQAPTPTPTGWDQPEPQQPGSGHTPTPEWAVDQGQHQSHSTNEEEPDPFLAELRRAVQDEGPLGPRDQPLNEDESSIDRLYAGDDDDKSGFFRRKK